MSDYFVKCKCNNFFPEDEFSRHFQRCEEFRKYFKNFDSQFGEFLKQNSEPKENLLIIKTLLKQYVAVLERKIENMFKDDPNFNPNLSRRNSNNFGGGDLIDLNNPNLPVIIRPNNPLEQINSNPINNSDNIPVNNHYREEPQQYIECCQICKDPNFTYFECYHTICFNCFTGLARKDITNMQCQQCSVPVSEGYKKMFLGEEYERLINASLIDCIGTIIECPQCKEKINFEKGHVDFNIKNEKNEIISKQAAENYAHNRCRCPSCKIDFCVGCRMTPYHTGMTCDERLIHVAAKRCKYDDNIITNNNRGPADDICKNEECVNTFKTACTKILKCGHKCFGCINEINCPPCLYKECNMYENIYDQNSDSYCNICYTEGLGNAPVILLSCNHYIHYKCVLTRLTKKWVGPKITFNHCLCPQCNSWLDAPNVNAIQKLVVDYKLLYEDICKKALERLKFEGLNKDAKLTDPNSIWYKKELAYALSRLSYYMCYECKKPYFAGLRECGEGPNVNNNNPDRPYDPKDLICGAHVNNFGLAGVTDCKTHGKEFIEYKCKFCCNIASWFCWGNTHFCEDCHAKQCKGDYVSKYSKDKLPKCTPSKCNVKVKHPDNGEEFGLGCSVCRNNTENIKNF